MLMCSPITTCAKHIISLRQTIEKQMLGHACAVTISSSSSCCLFNQSWQLWQRNQAVNICRTFSCSSVGSQASRKGRLKSCLPKHSTNWQTLKIKSSAENGMTCIGFSSRHRSMGLRLSMPHNERVSKISWNVRTENRLLRGASRGLILGVFVYLLSSGPASAEVPISKNGRKDEHGLSSVTTSHGKKVYTDYFITGIPGDGSCLFRSVVHGACVRSGRPSPNANLQKELADELRSMVADEFVKRREETEWFIEGDFDTYVEHIRKPHVWGGEPELLMASHVLQMPITVYMHDEDSDGLIAIAEYGQEYGKENPIRVIYHGFGHYDALQIPGKKCGHQDFSSKKREAVRW